MALIAPLTILTLLATALPAFAHHPEVTGDASCLPHGDVQVDWEAISWVTDGSAQGLNDDIRVSYREDGGAWQALATGAFTVANGQSFGSHDAGYSPLVYAAADTKPASVQFRVHADDAWGNGSPGGQTRTSGSITLPTDCVSSATPVDPTVSVSEECGVADSMVVPTTTGVIYQLGGAGDDVSGETITGPAAGTLTATAAPGYTLGDAEGWTFDYDLAAAEPCATDVEVVQECIDGSGSVTVAVETNTDEDFTATIGETTLDVTQGTVTFDGLEDGTYTVTVHDSQGEVVHTEQFVVDCDDPVVTVQTCTPEGALAVTITEVPDDWFEVTVDGAELEEPLVQDGVTEAGTLTLYFDVPDGEYTVSVIHDGPWSHTQTIMVDCAEPVVEVATACVSEDGTVTVTVTESPEDAFTATIDGTTVDVVDGVAVVEGLEDGTYTVTVHDSGELVHTEQVTVDCDEPDETEVEGVVIERPTPAPAPAPAPTPPAVAPAAQQLPATGADASLLGVVVLLLLGLGVSFVHVTRPAPGTSAMARTMPAADRLAATSRGRDRARVTPLGRRLRDRSHLRRRRD